MSKSKIIFSSLMLTGLLAVGTHSYAQTDSSKVKQMTDRLQTALDLDSGQYIKVYAVNEQFINQVAALKKSHEKRLSKFREMKTIDADHNKQLKQILTGDQYKIYEQMKEETRERMRQGYQNNQQ